MEEYGTYMTPNEIATFLKLNERTIRRMMNRGELKAFKVGRSWRMRTSEFVKWLEKVEGECLTAASEQNYGNSNIHGTC